MHAGGINLFEPTGNTYNFSSYEAVYEMYEKVKKELKDNIDNMPNDEIKKNTALLTGLEQALMDLERLVKIENKVKELFFR